MKFVKLCMQNSSPVYVLLNTFLLLVLTYSVQVFVGYLFLGYLYANLVSVECRISLDHYIKCIPPSCSLSCHHTLLYIVICSHALQRQQILHACCTNKYYTFG